MTQAEQVTIDVSALGISEYALRLFVGGFPRDAIRHEAQDLLNELQERVGRDDIDGQTLIEIALKDDRPILAINERSNPRERDEHAALRLLLLGVTRGVRNVYSHDIREEVTQLDAAIWLGLLGRLRRQVEDAFLVSAGPALTSNDEPTAEAG